MTSIPAGTSQPTRPKRSRKRESPTAEETSHEGSEPAGLHSFIKKIYGSEDAMWQLATCLFIGLTVAIGCNIPEIRLTLESHQARPAFGTVAYLTTTTIAYGVALWLLTMLLAEVLLLQ
jgi:hypothetical protein